MSKLSILRLEPQLMRILTKNMPPHAAVNYGKVRDEADSADAWHEANLVRDQALARQQHVVKDEFARLSHYPHEKEAIAALKEEIAEIEAKRAAVRAEPNPHESIPDRFDRTIMRFGVSAKFVDGRVTAPMLKGEKEPDALIRVRAEIGDLYKKRKTIENAHADDSEIKRRVVDSVDRLAADAPVFSYLLSGPDHRGIEWPQTLIVEGDRAREIPNGSAILAAVFREEMVSRLTEMALKQRRGPGMSDTERRRKLAKLDVQIMDAERAEEDLVCRCKTAGVPVRRDFRFIGERVHDMRRVLVILGVERDTGEFG